MEESFDVEAFYVCVNLHLFVSPGQPCQGVNQDSLISMKFTLIVTGLARFKCFQRDLSVNVTQNSFWDRSIGRRTEGCVFIIKYILARYHERFIGAVINNTTCRSHNFV